MGDVTAVNTNISSISENINSHIEQLNEASSNCSVSNTANLVAPANCPGGSRLSGVDVLQSGEITCTLDAEGSAARHAELAQSSSQTLEQIAETTGQNLNFNPGSISSTNISQQLSELSTIINESSTNSCRSDSTVSNAFNASCFFVTAILYDFSQNLSPSFIISFINIKESIASTNSS